MKRTGFKRLSYAEALEKAVKRDEKRRAMQSKSPEENSSQRDSSNEQTIMPGIRPRKKLIHKICASCGKQFEVWFYRTLEGAKYCSRSCSAQAQKNKLSRVCRTCGKSFKISPGQLTAYKGAGQYCSRECSYKGQIAKTDSKPPKDRYGRTRRKVDKDWQLAVRLKDNYTCQKCGKYEQYIHAHHVAPRSRRPDLKYDVSNGKCLCNSCHTWVHEHPVEATALKLLSDASFELAHHLKGAEHNMAKLNDEDVMFIRQRFANGERTELLAEEFHIHKAHVYHIVSGRAWKHLPLVEVMK